MGVLSFSGRVLFSAIFILAAWQKVHDFGQDGGNALKALRPKYDLFKQHVHSTLHLTVPDFELKYVLMAAIATEGLGALLFVFGSKVGAYLLLIFLSLVTPIMHDFYNYELSNPAYVREFIQALKNVSLAGALIFYLGMAGGQKPRKKPIKAKSS